MRLLILSMFTLLVGCNKLHVQDNLDPYHFEVITEDLRAISKIKSLSSIKDNMDNLREYQSTYCAYASENHVRYMIAQELIMGDSMLNALLTSGDRITEGGSIHPYLAMLENLKNLDEPSMDQVLEGLEKSKAAKDVNRKQPKLWRAIKQGYDNQTQPDKSAAIEMGAAFNCGLSSLYLFSLNQDESGIVVDTLNSIVSQAMISSISS
ncbi:MAG: hypothetical protein CML22_07070 [Rheinheimera sp.]|nr:hypothetical protein [Rheinheimera sp.]MBM34045.1 hypothetical protein [Rheinheimera sp.]